MSEFIVPFHVPAPGANGNVGYIRMDAVPAGDDVKAELVVLSGGPVFISQGRNSAASMQSAATTDPPDWDLAASVAFPTTAQIGTGEYTAWAAAESFGHIKLTFS